ncbi:hypothetical protein ACGFIW_28760 [Micromonospora sp. NPDC048935]|uniref:hypothetical protein n=1 Tax=Micromonospora sp. NPDC048935 TaxID=3364262 RepID=UPI003717611C
MSRNPDVPSIQAFRYAAGLSQDQAAVRYNEVAGHQTSLGGTTINAWETWARTRGSGSPPPFSSLLILATAYSRGPLGVAKEDISPSDLVAEAYERLAPEDQIALKALSARNSGWNEGPKSPAAIGTTTSLPAGSNIIGPDFNLTVPTVDFGNPEICVFTLPNLRPGNLLDLTWETFGFGLERIIRQIKNVGGRLDVDICFGVNEAGLVMATFLASAQFSRCAIGYLRCNRARNGITLASNSFYPDSGEAPTILICDFEVKHANVVGYLAHEIRLRYPNALLYFAVFGAMTKGSNLEVASFDDLTGAQIMRAAEFSAVFIAATMSPPGIEPPLELR